MLLDFDAEEKLIDEEMHWASKSESEVASDTKRALRKLDDKRKDLDSQMQDLQQRRDNLIDIIEGRVRPSLVDLPEEEAQDFRTKLRLRVKGVRGIAIERAREDLIPVEEDIEKTEERIERLKAETKPANEKGSKALKALADLGRSIREQRRLLRRARSAVEGISRTTDVFGSYNPYLLTRKTLEEVMISRRKLERKEASVQKRREEIAGVEQRVRDVKEELNSVLGEAYEASLMPLIFKDGRSPRGRRFVQNELTLQDVESLDLSSKIAHHKSMGRRADRFSPVLWEHRNFISQSLRRIARLCELRVYTDRLLKIASNMESAARTSLRAKVETHDQILNSAEGCGEVLDLLSTYLEMKEATLRKKRKVEKTLDRFRSNL